jgi:alpha 1,3-glucosidase
VEAAVPPAAAPENAENGEAVANENEEKQAADANDNQQQNHDEEPDMWEETFKSHTDSKPNGRLFVHKKKKLRLIITYFSGFLKGPESIGMDMTFNDFKNVYGIPQHADSFSLKSTT